MHLINFTLFLASTCDSENGTLVVLFLISMLQKLPLVGYCTLTVCYHLSDKTVAMINETASRTFEFLALDIIYQYLVIR